MKYVAVEQSIRVHCRQPPHGLSQDGDVRFVSTQSCQAASPPTPGLAALAAFPEPPGTPFALRRAMFREEKKEISGLRAHETGDRPIPGNRRSH
jgi:hypothetical protein